MEIAQSLILLLAQGPTLTPLSDDLWWIHHATLPYERQSTFSFKSKIVFTFSIFHTYYNIYYLPIPIYYLYNKSITAS